MIVTAVKPDELNEVSTEHRKRNSEPIDATDVNPEVLKEESEEHPRRK